VLRAARRQTGAPVPAVQAQRADAAQPAEARAGGASVRTGAVQGLVEGHSGAQAPLPQSHLGAVRGNPRVCRRRAGRSDERRQVGGTAGRPAQTARVRGAPRAVQDEKLDLASSRRCCCWDKDLSGIDESVRKQAIADRDRIIARVVELGRPEKRLLPQLENPEN
jgi:hypothetical protein